MCQRGPEPTLELVLASPATCADCGGRFMHLRRSRPNSTRWRPGRVATRCPACMSPATSRRRNAARQRLDRARKHGNLNMACGCGRDYLQVPLGEAHLCPHPRAAKPTDLASWERHADYQARWHRERKAAARV